MSFYRLLHLDTFSFFFFEISLFLSFCGALRVTSITNSVDHTHTHTHTQLSFGLHMAVVNMPFLSTMFGLSPLRREEWEIVLGFSLPIILLEEVMKWLSRHLE
jgi:hypothetical protein